MLGMLAVIAMTLLAIDSGPSKEELLVSEVQGKYPESTNWPGKTIVNIAKDTCSQLDDGATMRGTINSIALKYPVGAEADYDLIAFTMVTGIRELCPQHLDKAREFAKQ
jgi:hypothetical protein